ncbi:MAG: substrate-binding domain-containing protein [Ruminococcus sp.]|nr:substrate-binding domain-containing protein [Ruminococcus sp.]MDE7137705.1 substrate-binding domain-containing protein [Ruminococcus sp.]
MKLFQQISTLFLLIMCFVGFDISVYNLFTKRYINSTSEQMQTKSIELDKYLPFDKNSEVVNIDTDFKLTENLPVVDGAAALYPVFSAFVNAVYPQDSVFFDGENFTPESSLQYTNTLKAYKSVVDGEADIIFCAEPSAEQLEYAEEQGAELEFIPIGHEAFVFIVSNENPVENLKVEQIRGIYSGKYKKWSQVGGDNKIIDPVQRIEGSGSQSVMMSFMDGIPMKKNLFGFMGRAVGFSFRYYVSEIVGNGCVKMLSVNGVYPDKDNISSGQYPVTVDFYAIYRKYNPNSNVKLMIDWILSDKGQEIIEKSGYIPIE